MRAVAHLGAAEQLGRRRGLALLDRAAFAPGRVVERVVGLGEAAALLPGFGRAFPAGMTVIDPLRG
ncbi:hypothetical protein ACWD5B_05985 [Streptomyces tanashiensis]